MRTDRFPTPDMKRVLRSLAEGRGVGNDFRGKYHCVQALIRRGLITPDHRVTTAGLQHIIVPCFCCKLDVKWIDSVQIDAHFRRICKEPCLRLALAAGEEADRKHKRRS